MLRTRATASSKYALHYIEQTAGRIQLPWLCPALARPHYAKQQNRTVATRPTISRSKTLPAPVTQSRHLASPATAPESFDRSDDYIPFAYGQSEYPVARDARLPRNGDLSPYDLSQILMLDPAELPDDSTDTGGSRLRNIDEIEATLDACLQVHRWDRAFTLLSQLSLFCQNNPVRLQNSFNRVLGALVDDLIRNRNAEHERTINEWIEVHMRKADLEPDAQTFALKLKAALETLVGSKRDRTIRRYWEMTKRYELESKVLGMRDVLDDRDLGRLSEICTLDVARPRSEAAPITFRPDESMPHEPEEKVEFHVRETEQKGLGLPSLRRSLSVFTEQNQDASVSISKEDPLTRRQRRLERDAIQAALDRWKAEFQKRASMGLMPTDLAHGEIGALLWQWHEMLAEKIKNEIKLAREEDLLPGSKTAQQKLRAECTPFLELLPAEHVAAITSIALMQIMSKLGASKSVKLVRLVTSLGQMLEHEYNATAITKQKSVWSRQAKAQNRSLSSIESDDRLETSLHRRSSHHAAKPFMYTYGWTKAIQAKVGAVLCELMFETARITIRRTDPTTGALLSMPQPVFLHSTTYSNGKRVGMVSLHEDFVKILITQPAEHLIGKQLPMVCPPKPWKGFREGAYLESKQPFLRIKHNESAQKDYAIAAASRGDLDQLFAGVDILGKTGWRINKNVFSIMLEAWNSGEEVANLPPLNKVFPEIEKPGENATHRERWQWFGKMRAVDNEKSGLHSNRCFQNFQMEIAKAYLDETFYLPHNVDFRGRAYPIPPYLNQMGADNCRGLLLFDTGRELGAEGLRWLKIHLSNVYGYDKASLSDRAQFPMDRLDEIYDSVRNPLNGNRWWLGAEDPWQCLATCFELTNALDSSDPTKYISRLPIHQDGSCNGLQHYAALGGDIAGARQVNLEPGDKPADVYTGVCELVKAEIKEDAARGDSLARLLDGKVTRKVVKQTVMTNVYGVTFLGAIRQVRRQVDDLIPEVQSAGLSGKASTYIAKKIFKGLGALFTGAHEIQYWLGDCANRISSSISPAQQEKIYEEVFNPKHEAEASEGGRKPKSKSKSKEVLESSTFRSPVIWTTPLKLPVVQPYRINKGQKIRTNLQSIMLAQPSPADSINKRKQLQAFPPNFIHSLDATHMVLSALKANEMGLSFSAVHDSFWTHAADVNTLNVLLRDAFIRMHSDDIVGRLAAEFNKRYDGHYYLAHINKNNVLGKDIAKYRKQMINEGVFPKGGSAKVVQQQRQAELGREVRRKKLLASSDPKERAEGEKMVTSATLFEKHDGDKYIFTRDSLGETAIGMVPESAEIANEDVLEEALHASGVAHDVDLASTLDPLRDSIANDHDEEALDMDDASSNRSGPIAKAHEVNVFGQKEVRKHRRLSKSQSQQTWLWLPIKFRPVPKKGDFDVKRLKDSVYFFS